MQTSKKQEYKGFFWLPEIINAKKVNGTLLISTRGKITLMTEEPLHSYGNQPTQFNIIWGNIHQKEISLFQSYYLEYNNFAHALNMPSHCSLRTQMVMIGDHVSCQDDIKISEADFLIHCSIPRLRGNPTFILDDGYELSSRIQGSKLAFKLKREEPFSFKDLAKIIRLILLFLRFVFDRMFNLNKVIIINAYNRSARILYPSVPFTIEKESLKPRNFLRFRTYDEFLTSINKWINFYQEYYPSLDLYFLFLTNSVSFLETKFIVLSQALESFHRLTEDIKNDIDENEYQELIHNISKADNLGKHKDWLINKMEYLNSISYPKRIRKLIKPFQKIFGNSRQREDLIGNLAETRNLLTHVSIENMRKVNTEKDLLSLTYKLDVILCLLVLSKLEFNGDQIEQAIKNNRIQFYLNIEK